VTDPAGLVARTRALPKTDRAELLALAGSDGILFARDDAGFAGRGVARRCSRTDVEAVLASIEVDDEMARPGSGPVAFGALPFLPDEPGELVVPSLVLAGDDDAAWVTSVAPRSAAVDPLDELRTALLAAGRPAPADGPSTFQVASVRAPADWEAAVATATARIRAGELDKVVLAREVTVTADAEISIATVLVRLAQHYPGCFLYLVDGFCGASPELLVSRSGDTVRAQPMAGTKPRRGIPEVDAAMAADLLASTTYRHEHQVTIDEVRDTLMSFSSYVDYEPEPSVVPLANVVHLATNVEGKLSHPPASILELVAALHPTPAVCGRPREAALAVIAELEGIDRGRYAGTVGWVDAAGNGQWAVSIRGAEIDGTTARVIAGNGMVGDSDPPTELIETRAKLQAMLSAIVRP
jgi:isochorismate synthase